MKSRKNEAVNQSDAKLGNLSGQPAVVSADWLRRARALPEAPAWPAPLGQDLARVREKRRACIHGGRRGAARGRKDTEERSLEREC